MAAQHTLTLPEAYDYAYEHNDFTVMQVVAESLVDLFIQIDQLDDTDTKINELKKAADTFKSTHHISHQPS